MGHHSRCRPRSGCGRASRWSSTSGHVMPGLRTLRFVPPRSQAPAVRIPLEPARAECEQQVQGARRGEREAEGSLLARHVPCSTGATHARSRSVAGSGCGGPRAVCYYNHPSLTSVLLLIHPGHSLTFFSSCLHRSPPLPHHSLHQSSVSLPHVPFVTVPMHGSAA